MLILVVSDFHLGKGQFLKNGQLNILEDFNEDDRFCEFLEYYSSGTNYWANVHLVLNGDILNLIQIDIDGVFSHIIDEEFTVKSLAKVANGHKAFFAALKSFLSKPNKKISYIIGNHDLGMAFLAAQKKFQELLEGNVDFSFSLSYEGIHIEHGHRFEVINACSEDQVFIEGPHGKKILNLPWGSLFCISLLPKLKKQRPYIDKVRPMSGYIKWVSLHDPIYFIKVFWILLKYFVTTRVANYTRQNRNFKTTMKILNQITIYPQFGRRAKSILNHNPLLHTVIMGHTHLFEWRKFPENKLYFNSGSWNPIPSIDAAMHQSLRKLTFVEIDFNSKTKTIRGASLKDWQGRWRPYRDEVSMSFT
ncbi:MAG: hypothetical protein A2504_15270 [Bdellovibrionales bacterium RIFOXYD12_FULL_39_22]|nr:MAG: hypothetical protein A2385_02700 [Bdellovibrionales bacterium RIFOXYB1_FULL_39_21]OFZ43156.1 MAG: hypothetical protein A2485_11845 [Bdellovibrionales bacterium RIFOXYC12_FULL_39_17]OFZ47894.1 MAG: hypothetical protein A2404_16485 [Bdellovibrionales bacterium RIFOXYC1_FULL_39_130]OFZ74840.1 MAG: hypothetical protein A2451_03305 [Bdellovibrionales bacterium RIFOXYC2_FULL_39_8]OFZ75674.1 MAG: hypothetical protein A2560_12985 [Bdellovibrionales bacterium RIFOXYD1_FULL_39_84]OFZ94164.1 MAG: